MSSSPSVTESSLLSPQGSDWVTALDNQIVMSQRKILEGKGKIRHDEAMEKAEREYNQFRQKELANLKSDFDLFLEETKKLSNKNSAK